jgi:hypothetical protein
MPLTITTPLFLAAVCFIPTVLIAQTAGPPMTSKLCDQQARAYVAEKNTHESEPIRGRSLYWSVAASHYDSHTNTCYVMYERFVSEDPPDSRVHSFFESIRIADVRATDSTIAQFADSCIATRDGRAECTKPRSFECQVNGQICESKLEFIELVHKWIPAFKPFKKQPAP